MKDREGKSGERERERNRKKTFYFLQKVFTSGQCETSAFPDALFDVRRKECFFFFSFLFFSY